MSVPWDSHRQWARELVEGNAQRYPDLLVEQMAHQRYDETRAIEQAAYCRELTIVALRMLKRAGKLKPTTDDERAAVELASNMVDLPAANRRLLHPMADPYVEHAVAVGQATLFDTDSQESVNEAEAA